MFYEILEKTFFQNTVKNYLICVGLFLVGVVVVKIFELFFLKRLKKLAEKTKTTLDDFVVLLIQKIAVPFSYFGIIYLAINTLNILPSIKKGINIAFVAIVTVFVARLIIRIVSHGLSLYSSTTGKGSSLEKSINGILKVVKVVVWGIAVTFFLDNLGFKISAVIAGLGIGGVAVALAAQAVLKDLFSYFAILFDRPFETGDFIILGDYLGTIENIGIKTTRVRSLGGEQLVFSNTDLTSSRLRNYKRMQKRRVSFKLGVTYQTPTAKLKAIPDMIEKAIGNVSDTVFDRAHFFSYGDFSLVFEVVYYVLSADYNKYMDIQQSINFGIKEAFDKEKIEFAYPPQTLYLNK